MGIIKDHGIIATLKDGNLRNDPEVLELLCDVLEAQDADIDELGGFKFSKNLDSKLELLNTAVDRAENEYDSEDQEDEDEDEELDEEDEDDEEELDFENNHLNDDDEDEDEDDENVVP